HATNQDAGPACSGRPVFRCGDVGHAWSSTAGQRGRFRRHASVSENGLPREPAWRVSASRSGSGGRLQGGSATGDPSPRNPNREACYGSQTTASAVVDLQARRVRSPPCGAFLRSRRFRPRRDIRRLALPVRDVHPTVFSISIDCVGVLRGDVLVVVLLHDDRARSVLWSGPPPPLAPHLGICSHVSCNWCASAARRCSTPCLGRRWIHVRRRVNSAAFIGQCGDGRAAYCCYSDDLAVPTADSILEYKRGPGDDAIPCL